MNKSVYYRYLSSFLLFVGLFLILCSEITVAQSSGMRQVKVGHYIYEIDTASQRIFLSHVAKEVRDTLRSFTFPDSVVIDGIKQPVYGLAIDNEILPNLSKIYVNATYPRGTMFKKENFPKLDTLVISNSLLVNASLNTERYSYYEVEYFKSLIDCPIFSVVLFKDDGPFVQRFNDWVFAHDSTLLVISSRFTDSILVLPEHITHFSTACFPRKTYLKHLVLGSRFRDFSPSDKQYFRFYFFANKDFPEFAKIPEGPLFLYPSPYRALGEVDHDFFKDVFTHFIYKMKRRSKFSFFKIKISEKHWSVDHEVKLANEYFYLSVQPHTSTVSAGEGGSVYVSPIDLRNYPYLGRSHIVKSATSSILEGNKDSIYKGMPYVIKAVPQDGFRFKYFLFRGDTIYSPRFTYVPIFSEETVAAHFSQSDNYDLDSDFTLSSSHDSLLFCRVAPRLFDLNQLPILSSIKKISPFAFESNLTTEELILPSSVNRISKNWFNYGSPLRVLIFQGLIDSIDRHAFSLMNNLRYLVFSKGVSFTPKSFVNAFSNAFDFNKLTLFLPNDVVNNWKDSISKYSCPITILPITDSVTLRLDNPKAPSSLTIRYEWNGEEDTVKLTHHSPEVKIPFCSKYSISVLPEIGFKCTALRSSLRDYCYEPLYSDGFAFASESFASQYSEIHDSVSVDSFLYLATDSSYDSRYIYNAKINIVHDSILFDNPCTLRKGSQFSIRTEFPSFLKPLYFLHGKDSVSLDSTLSVHGNMKLKLVYDSIIHSVSYKQMPNSTISISTGNGKIVKDRCVHDEKIDIDIRSVDGWRYCIDSIFINGKCVYPGSRLPITYTVNSDTHIEYSMKDRWYKIDMDNAAETFLIAKTQDGRRLHNGDSAIAATNITVDFLMNGGYTTKAVTINNKRHNITKYSQPFRIKLLSNLKLRAYGKSSQFSVSYSRSLDGGNVLVQAKSLRYEGKKFLINFNDTLLVKLLPSNGYEAGEWTINGIAQASDSALWPVKSDVRISARFIPVQYSIYYPKEVQGGSLFVRGKNGKKIASGKKISAGEQITIDAIPKKGFRLSSFRANDTIKLSNPSVLRLYSDLSIDCRFEELGDTVIDGQEIDLRNGHLKNFICNNDSVAIVHPAVLGISANAFKDPDTTLKALYIGPHVRVIQGNALANLKSLERLYFYGSDLRIYKSTLNGLKSLRKIHLLSSGPTVFKFPKTFGTSGKRRPPVYFIVPSNSLDAYADCNSERVVVIPDSVNVSFKKVDDTFPALLKYWYVDWQGREYSAITDTFPLSISLPGGIPIYWSHISDSQYFLRYTYTDDGLSVIGTDGYIPNSDVDLVLFYDVKDVNSIGDSEAPAIQDQITPVQDIDLRAGIVNPFDRSIQFIKPFDETVTYALFDVKGILLQSGTLAQGEQEILLKNVLSPGFYLLRMSTPRCLLQMVKLVKM